jgi:hypothetical protein
MQDAAWAIGLFGGIAAALIFLFWWICDGTDEAANCGGQYKSPGLNGSKAGASIFGRAARYTRNSSGRLRPEWVQRL